MTYEALADLNNEDYLVVDLDTGTVLGANLVLIRTSKLDEDTIEEILSDDSTAAEYGENPDYAEPLWVENK